MLSWIKDKTQAARATLTAEASKFRHRDFMEAVVAACAVIAYADGTVSAEEKQKMIGYVTNADELKHFKTEDVIAFFQKVLGKFEFDADIGRAEALKVVGKVRAKPDQARMCVRLACVIGAADGDFDEKEKAVVRLICTDLGLNPADFGL